MKKGDYKRSRKLPMRHGAPVTLGLVRTVCVKAIEHVLGKKSVQQEVSSVERKENSVPGLTGF